MNIKCRECKKEVLSSEIHADLAFNWCKTCFNQYCRNRYHTNALAKARDKRWRDSHREYTVRKNKNKQLADKIKIVTHYSNGDMVCARCKLNDIRALTLDHMNGDGHKSNVTLRSHLYRQLIKDNYPIGYQILCMSCQFIKAAENKEFIKKQDYKTTERVRNRVSARHHSIRKEVLCYYSKGTMACVKCNMSDIRALTIDHVNGGGNKHRNNRNICDLLIKENFPDGYQTLCMSCQFIKKHENQEHYKGVEKMENTLLERLLQAVDEVVLYRTDGKIQALKKVREEIRQKNENADEAAYRKLWPDMVPGAYNDY